MPEATTVDTPPARSLYEAQMRVIDTDRWSSNPERTTLIEIADGTIPAAFKVTESTVTSKGVIIVKYERAGAVPTGSL